MPNGGATEMRFGSFDGRGDGEHDGVGFVEMTKVFVLHVDVLIWNIAFSSGIKLTLKTSMG